MAMGGLGKGRALLLLSEQRASWGEALRGHGGRTCREHRGQEECRGDSKEERAAEREDGVHSAQ